MEPFVEDHHLVGFAVPVPDQPRSRLDGCSRLASVRTRRDYQQPLARGGFQPVNRLFLQPIGDRSGEQLPAQIGCGLMIRLGPLRSELIDRQLSQGTNPLLDSIGVCQPDPVLCSDKAFRTVDCTRLCTVDISLLDLTLAISPMTVVSL